MSRYGKNLANKNYIEIKYTTKIHTPSLPASVNATEKDQEYPSRKMRKYAQFLKK